MLFIARYIGCVILVLLLNGISFGKDKFFPGMEYFPEGEFEMGSTEGKGKKNEHPRHKVYLSAFFLDKYEVTFADFEAYLEDNLNKYPTITGWIDHKARVDMIRKPIFGLQWKRCRNYFI